MLTPVGLAWVTNLVSTALAGAQLVVSDGEQSATAVVESVGIDEETQEVVLRATFGEGEANFEWRERYVQLADGTNVDALTEDQGRKAVGSIWVLEARIRIEAV